MVFICHFSLYSLVICLTVINGVGGGVKQFLRARWKAYIIPYFILSFINLIINIPVEIVNGICGKQLLVSSLKHIFWIAYSYGDASKTPNCTPLWFLPCLFICSIIVFYLVQIEDASVLLAVCVFLSMVDCLLFRYDVIQLPWHIDTALLGSVYMMIGYKFKESNQLNKILHPFIAIVLLMLVGGYCIYTNGFIALNSNRINNIILTYVGSVLISVAVFILVKSFLPQSPFLELMGRNTIIIMGFNYAVNYYISKILHLFVEGNIEWWMISIADVFVFYCLYGGVKTLILRHNL